MPVEALEHCTIRCADLEATRGFYETVLGLKPGPRPELEYKGYWIYCAGQPLIQLVEADSESQIAGNHAVGPLDHLAFRSTDLERTRERFHNMGLEFEERRLPTQKLHQILLADPNGIRVELNFHVD